MYHVRTGTIIVLYIVGRREGGGAASEATRQQRDSLDNINRVMQGATLLTVRLPHTGRCPPQRGTSSLELRLFCICLGRKPLPRFFCPTVVVCAVVRAETSTRQVVRICSPRIITTARQGSRHEPYCRCTGNVHRVGSRCFNSKVEPPTVYHDAMGEDKVMVHRTTDLPSPRRTNHGCAARRKTQWTFSRQAIMIVTLSEVSLDQVSPSHLSPLSRLLVTYRV
jgi:hypothetical protein